MSSSMLSPGKPSQFFISGCGNSCNPNPTGLQPVRAPAGTTAGSPVGYGPSPTSLPSLTF